MSQPSIRNALLDVSTRRIFEMVDAAKQRALAGDAVSAEMLMRLLTVDGGKEVLWTMTNAAQRRDIAAIAKLWKNPTSPGNGA